MSQLERYKIKYDPEVFGSQDDRITKRVEEAVREVYAPVEIYMYSEKRAIIVAKFPKDIVNEVRGIRGILSVDIEHPFDIDKS